MSSRDFARISTEDREQASQVAADLVQAHYDDPEAVVRLVFSEGLGNEVTFHFDASGPAMHGRPLIIVYRVGLKWEAAFIH